ncbi:MAG TPA: hypothetical protein DIU00_18970 [Phycisphaerales bacterium]|nr:hypothetical protein [Phycisphaerales bacterium]
MLYSQVEKFRQSCIAINGCKLDCMRNCLRLAGFIQFERFRVTEQG